MRAMKKLDKWGQAEILWVCSSQSACIKRYDALGHPENVQMITPASALAGSRFNEIILEDVYFGIDNSTLKKSIDEWIHNLHCRLTVDGEMKVIEKVG